jgi:hypothetical protein
MFIKMSQDCETVWLRPKFLQTEIFRLLLVIWKRISLLQNLFQMSTATVAFVWQFRFSVVFLRYTCTRFWTSVFYHQKKAPGPLISTKYTFEYKFEFAEIFEFEGHSEYYQYTGNKICLS